MILFRRTLILLLSCAFALAGFAQTNCGNSGAPTFVPTLTGAYDLGETLPIPNLASTGPTPTVEYAITVQGNPATDGYGDAILGFTTASSFSPADYGVQAGDRVCLQPVGYDLVQVQNMIDQIFNGTFFFQPCCNFVGLVVPDFCPNLIAGGITSGSDIQDLGDVLDLLAIFSGNPNSTVSVNGFIREVDTLNVDAADLPAPCGGNSVPICYAVAGSLTAGRIVCYDITIPLSIELSNFDVVAERSTMELSWTTLSEANNDYFAVERSMDGIDFVEIGQVLGVGDSFIPTFYNYVDRAPLYGNNYYRLASYDYEGNVNYSEIKVAKWESDMGFELLTVGPNPTKGDLEVIINSPNTNGISYQIQDITGRMIQTGFVESVIGLNNYSLDVNGLNNGLYILTFRNEKTIENFKFIRN